LGKELRGVKAVVLNHGKALVLREAKGTLDLPGGRVEDDEGYQEGLIREVLEETGLEIEVLRLAALWWLPRNGKQVEGITYLCKCSRGGVCLSKEHTGYVWVPVEQLRKIGLKHPYGVVGLPLGWLHI
jgi:8-oxo-dGTP pyrophosphatase MutT (NUDIX family)